MFTLFYKFIDSISSQVTTWLWLQLKNTKHMRGRDLVTETELKSKSSMD